VGSEDIKSLVEEEGLEIPAPRRRGIFTLGRAEAFRRIRAGGGMVDLGPRVNAVVKAVQEQALSLWAQGYTPVQVFLKQLTSVIKEVHSEIEGIMRLVVELARGDGVKISVQRRSCRRSTCGTCLGRYAYHYPYLVVYDGGKRVCISTTNLRDFLKKWLSNEEIEYLMNLIDLRHALIQLYNYSRLTFRALGAYSEEV